jgi:hypothetical protein
MVLEIALGVILGVIGLYALVLLLGLGVAAFESFLDSPIKFLKLAGIVVGCAVIAIWCLVVLNP